MRRLVPAAAVALILTAGCATLGVQAPEQTYSEDEVVSLVEGMNTTAAQELTRTHWQTLGNTSSYRGAYRSKTGSEDRYNRTVVVDRADRQFVKHWVDSGSGKRGDVYANETTQVRRYLPFQNETYEYTVRDSGFGKWYADEGPLPDDVVLVRHDWEYIGRVDGGFAFEAEHLVDPETVDYGHFYWNMAEATDANARMVVDERGFVRSLNTSVTLEEGGTARTEQFEMRVWAVGDADAERPEWVDEAT